MEATVTTAYKHKIVFVGNISVGKTSVINRYVHGSYIEEYQPTVGIDFVTKSIYLKETSQTLQIQLWDTAGQERFQSVIPIYIKDSSISIVVYDVTDQKSFDNIEKWVTEIRNIRGENADIIVVGNKTDLTENRKVSKEDAAKKMETIKIAKYFEASAKFGDGIAQMFDEVVKMLSEKLPLKTAEDAQRLNPYTTNTPQETKDSKCGC
jgi:Ras-related protein Rab-6A